MWPPALALPLPPLAGEGWDGGSPVHPAPPPAPFALSLSKGLTDAPPFALREIEG